jgi:hypothetical protein
LVPENNISFVAIMNYLSVQYVQGRLQSIEEQVGAVADLHVEDLLEIGIVSGLFRFIIQKTCKVTSMDLDESLSPDVNGSILDPFPFNDDSFDCIVAFEVFEHVPLKYLDKILRETKRVARRYIVFSVPDREWYVRLGFASNYGKFGGLASIPRLCKKLKPEDVYQGDRHYWHIGDQGVSRQTIRDIIYRCGLQLITDYRYTAYPDHHLFICKK